MGMEIGMTRAIPSALIDQARLAHPQEACGLLLGWQSGVVRRIQPCTNRAADPATTFEIDPAELIAALRAEREGREVVIGYYHSHPSGDPRPSATDIAHAAHDGRIWAIIAGGTAGHAAGNAVGWWRDGADGFIGLSTWYVDG